MRRGHLRFHAVRAAPRPMNSPVSLRPRLKISRAGGLRLRLVYAQARALHRALCRCSLQIVPQEVGVKSRLGHPPVILWALVHPANEVLPLTRRATLDLWLQPPPRYHTFCVPAIVVRCGFRTMVVFALLLRRTLLLPSSLLLCQASRTRCASARSSTHQLGQQRLGLRRLTGLLRVGVFLLQRFGRSSGGLRPRLCARSGRLARRGRHFLAENFQPESYVTARAPTLEWRSQQSTQQSHHPRTHRRHANSSSRVTMPSIVVPLTSTCAPSSVASKRLACGTRVSSATKPRGRSARQMSSSCACRPSGP